MAQASSPALPLVSLPFISADNSAASAPAPKRRRTESAASSSSSSSSSSGALKTGSKLYYLVKEQETISQRGTNHSFRIINIFSDLSAANFACLKHSFVQSHRHSSEFAVGLDAEGQARAIYNPDTCHMTRVYVGQAGFKSGTKTEGDVRAELRAIQADATEDIDDVEGRYDHVRGH